MNKKGFTLVELLAVIVILAIIALISTPIILGVIETAKKGAAEQSALGYIDAVEKQIVYNQVKENQTPLTNGTYETDVLNSTYGVNVKGTKPTTGSWVQIEKKEIVAYSLKIGEYVVNYKEADKKVEVIKNGTIEEKPNGSTVSGPTMTAPSETDKHKGIVYLDPTNLNKTCNASNSESIKERIEGCMKWYIFDDSGNNYTMILDHNTTATVAWNSTGSNSEMKEVASQLQEDTKTWDSSLNVRLITANEVAKITGNTKFDANEEGQSWFYLDGKKVTDKNASQYAWLYDYTNGCTSNGCNIADSSTWGYWTSTPVIDHSSHAWRVGGDGGLSNNGVSFTSSGVRPVITVSKSKIS